MPPCTTQQGSRTLLILLCGYIICASSAQVQQSHLTEETFLTFLTPISSRVTNQKCRNDSLLYIQHLRNFTLWATKMFDASAKLPVGLLAGNTYQMGHFDECLQVGYEEAPTDVVPVAAPVQGQYCLARLQLSPRHQTYPGFTRKDVLHAFSLQYDPNLSAWEKFMIPIDPSKKRRDVFHTAVCVPASCDPQDVETSMRAALESVQELYGVNVEVNVDPKMCQTKSSKPYSTADLVILVIILMTAMLAVLASLYDMTIYRQRRQQKQYRNSTFEKVLLAFSAYSNLEKLNTPNKSKDMSILHGMRLISMLLIVFGHRCVSSFSRVTFNPENIEKEYRNFASMILFNGIIVVDTFFLLSGFLTCYGILTQLSRKNFNVGLMYLHRWLRLTPVYMMMVAFYATLLDKTSTGPIWNDRVGTEKQRCVDNWWTNLLFINNYVNSNQMCMFQSWYIACDMHYFLIAPLIVLPLYRKPPLGMAILGGFILISLIVPFAVTYVGGYIGVLRVYMSLMEDPTTKEEYYKVYIKSHNRATPYLIGIVAGYIYTHMKRKGLKVPRIGMYIGTIVTLIFGFGALFGAWICYIPGREYYPLEHALYASLHRLVYAISLSWVIIAGCTTTFNVWQPLLQLHAFLPLSRLTYCAFLVHGAVQLYFLGVIKHTEDITVAKFIWSGAGDITISFIFALFAHLLFEAPIAEIQKLIFSRNSILETNKLPQQNGITDEEIQMSGTTSMKTTKTANMQESVTLVPPTA